MPTIAGPSTCQCFLIRVHPILFCQRSTLAFCRSHAAFFFFFFSFCTFSLSSFWTSRGHRCLPFSSPVLAFNFIAHRVQQSHCSSIVHRVLLTHALALFASQFVHKKKSQRIYTSMHSAGLELTKLTKKKKKKKKKSTYLMGETAASPARYFMSRVGTR